MKKTLIVLLVELSLAFCASTANNWNSFEVTFGCKQYSTKSGYDYPHPYYSTNKFRNIRVTENNVTQLRMGVLVRSDGNIRLAPIEYPYTNTQMNEIVLSGYDGTATVARRYIRSNYNRHTDMTELARIGSQGLLSEFRPMMFTMEIDRTGNVKLTEDGDVIPFFEFKDPRISFNYIGFCNWDAPAIFFFDCPILN